jgi:hypothetical protein
METHVVTVLDLYVFAVVVSPGCLPLALRLGDLKARMNALWLQIGMSSKETKAPMHCGGHVLGF